MTSNCCRNLLSQNNKRGAEKLRINDNRSWRNPLVTYSPVATRERVLGTAKVSILKKISFACRLTTTLCTNRHFRQLIELWSTTDSLSEQLIWLETQRNTNITKTMKKKRKTCSTWAIFEWRTVGRTANFVGTVRNTAPAIWLKLCKTGSILFTVLHGH